MATCIINYKDQTYSTTGKVAKQLGKESRVGARIDNSSLSTESLTMESLDSRLFSDLASIPNVDAETALQVYEQVTSEEVKKLFGETSKVPLRIDNSNLRLTAEYVLNQVESSELGYLDRNGEFTTDYNKASDTNNLFIRNTENESELHSIREVSKIFNEQGDPKVFYKTKDESVYTKYSEALNNAFGAPIEVGILIPQLGISFEGNNVLNVNESSFIPVATIDSSIDVTTQNGFVNYAINNGSLSDKKVMVGEEFVYTGIGEDTGTAHASMMLAASEAIELGFQVQVHGTTGLTVTESSNNKTEVINNQGEAVLLTADDIITMLETEGVDYMKANFPGYQHLLYLAMDSATPVLGIDNVETNETKKQPRTDDDLRVILLGLMDKLGIKMTSISEYLQKHRIKYGDDPSVEAIADLINQIIAVADPNTVDAEILAEELSHFILQAYDNQTVIEELLAEVETTEEWQSESTKYYEMYGRTLEGEALDNAVRMEVLGKVLARKIGERFVRQQNETQSTGFFASLRQIWNNFVELIRSTFNVGIKSSFDSIMDEIADKALSMEILENYDKLGLTEADTEFFSLTDKREIVSISKAIEVLEQRRNALMYESDPSVPGINLTLAQLKEVQKKAKEVTQELKDTNVLYAMKVTAAMAHSILHGLQQRFYHPKTGTTVKVTNKDKLDLTTLGNMTEVLAEMKSTLVRNPPTSSNFLPQNYYKNLVESIDTALTDIATITPVINNQLEGQLDKTVENWVRRFNLTGEDAQNLRDSFNSQQKDIGFINSWFGMLEHQSNVFLRALGYYINRNMYKATERYLSKIQPLLEIAEKNSFNLARYRELVQKLPNGKLSQYFDSILDRASFYTNRDEAYYKAYLEATNKTTKDLSQEDYQNELKKGHYSSLDLNPTQRLKFEESIDNWRTENEERRMTPEYYKQARELWFGTHEVEVESREINGITRYFIDDVDVSDYINSTNKNAYYLSETSRSISRTFSARRAEILQKYREEGKRLDYSKISEEDMRELERIKIEKANVSSFIDIATGEQKLGEDLKTAIDMRVVSQYYSRRFEGTSQDVSDSYMDTIQEMLDDAEEIARRGMGISQAIDRSALSSDQLMELNRRIAVLSNENIKNFVDANGGFGLNQRYYDIVQARGESYIDRLSELLKRVQGSPNLVVYEQKLADLKAKMEWRNNILKAFKDPNNLSNIMTQHMTSENKRSILEVEEEINQLNQSLRGFLKENLPDTDPLEFNIESNVNESYKRDLDNSELSERDFLKKHMTNRNRTSYELMLSEFEILQADPSKGVSDSTVRQIRRMANLNSDGAARSLMLQHQQAGALLDLAIEWGRTRVLPYYKASSPQGYNLMMRRLNDNIINYGQVIEKLSDMETSPNKAVGDDTVYGLMKFSPNYEWFSENDMVNEFYRTDDTDSSVQPKIDKYLNHDYVNKYGINVNELKTSGMIRATRNIENYEMLQLMIDTKRTILENYKELGKHDVYLLPQFSKGNVERFIDITKGKVGSTIGNTIRDIGMNRVDTKEYGELVGESATDGSTTAVGNANKENYMDVSTHRVIPKYGLTRLEETADTSHELLYSISMMLNESLLYTQKLDTISEVNMLEQQLRQKTRSSKNDTSNSLKMFNEFRDYYYYGIKQNFKATMNFMGWEIDLGKIIKFFDRKILRVINIGLNPAVALTSGAISELTKRIESWTGEHYSVADVNFADKEFMRLSAGYVTEYGKVDNGSKLQKLFEAFGVKNVSERTMSSGFNRIIRSGNGFMHKMLELTNIPVNATTMLTVLNGTRMVQYEVTENGETVTRNGMVTYEQFRKLTDNTSLTKEELETKWKSYANETLYNMLEVRDGTIQIKDEYYRKYLNETIGGEHVLDVAMEHTRNRVISTSSVVQGIMPNDDRMRASRNFILGFTDAHRGWMILTLQRMTKQRSFNFRTGQVEEGFARTPFRYMMNVLSDFLNEENKKDLIKNITENWHKLSDMEKRNFQRILIHSGTALSLLVIGLAVAAGVDDDEPDPFFVSYGSYIYFRLVNETMSVHPIYGISGVLDYINTPFVAANNIKEWTDRKNYSLAEVQSGNYAGHSKLYRHLAKQSHLKHYYNTVNVENTMKTYRHMNERNLMWLGQ